MQITITRRRALSTLAATAVLTAMTVATAGPGGVNLAVAAGAPASVSCTGAQQGLLTKSTVNGAVNTVALASSSHSISIPTDASSGQATGKRVHRPYSFTKVTDASSIPFTKAAVNGELLTSCTFRYYVVNPSGTTTNYLTVRLDNARVSAYSFSHSSTENESWSLAFQKITWTMGTTTFQDCLSCTVA